MTVYDRWHKARPQPGEARCGEHHKVPTADHDKGDLSDGQIYLPAPENPVMIRIEGW